MNITRSVLTTGGDATDDAPGGDIVENVRQAWAEVLDVTADQVPLDTNFLEAGGSSLLLIMLWEQLSELTEQRLRVSDLFQHSTVRAQTALLVGGVQDAMAALGTRDRRQLLGRARRTGSAGHVTGHVTGSEFDSTGGTRG